MEKLFIKTFDAIKIGEESKQKIKEKLIEYQNNLAINKNKKNARKFKWTMPRIAIAASTAVVLLFCAIFFPILAFNGGTETPVTSKAQILAAFNNLKAIDSYVETIENTMNIDGEDLVLNLVTSYQKTKDGYIAVVLMESFRYYIVGAYMYVPGSQGGGVKVRLPEEMGGEQVSFVQFFIDNSGYLTPELVNNLDDSDIETQSIDAQNIYTFKSKTFIGGSEVDTQYNVSINNSLRITRIKQVANWEVEEVWPNGTVMKPITEILIATYNYVDITIDLPYDIDTYIEYPSWTS